MSFTREMTRDQKPRSGVALGGIGTGWFELRHDGCFYNWMIMNNKPLNLGEPIKDFEDSMLFFVVRYQEAGGEPKMKLLQVEPEYGAASIVDHPHYYVFPWLDGIDRIQYDATVPFINMRYSDDEMPFEIEMTAWSPFIPNNVKDSALPAALFDFKVISKTSKQVDVMLMASMRNVTSYDRPEKHYAARATEGKGYRGYEMWCDNVPKTHSSTGTMAMASVDKRGSSYYLGWEHRHPYYEIALRESRLPDIDDTAGRHKRDEKGNIIEALGYCNSTVAVSKRLNGRGKSFDHSFVMGWHFPNRYAQLMGTQKQDRKISKRNEGHYYDNYFDNAADVVDYVVENRNQLRKDTQEFHDAYYDSTAPQYVLDQVNSHLNTYRTSSWLTKDGNFGILEGLDPYRAYAGLGTTDVAQYGSVPTAALFPELDRALIHAHRSHQQPNGVVIHSIQRNFREFAANEATGKRLDMPSQYAFRALRAYIWSGDKKYLEDIWPSIKMTLDYVLRERDMNGDLLPDMEGVMCSYDNFPMYGVASYVASQWLAAVAAARDAAEVLGDTEAEERYAEVLEKGAKVFEEKLWNGEYYRLCNDEGGENGEVDEGCLSDQIIGLWTAHQINAPHFLKKSRVKKALRSVMKRNFHPDYGLRNCSWPEDEFLHAIDENTWVDQANTCWSGVELAFASFLFFEGMWREGLKVVKNVDDRYRKSGMYFDHLEFGGHYFRPMSAWAIVNGMLGLKIAHGTYVFDPQMPEKEQRLFFAYYGGYGHYERQKDGRGWKVTLEADSGNLALKEIHLGLPDKAKEPKRISLNGKMLSQKKYEATVEGKTLIVRFPRGISVRQGKNLSVTV
jgi:non-lysosomal glucosylceramidase